MKATNKGAHMAYTPPTTPQAVIASIRKAYPNEADEILAALRYDNIMRCWYFIRGGVYTACESCGYRHQ
jgi:hypothetical protein